MTVGLTGIASLEAEMRDRLADKNREIESLRAQLAKARAALEEIPRLIASTKYEDPTCGSAESAWNAACDHIEEGIAALQEMRS